MKTGLKTQGFTVVEVLIVLAVTSILFVMAVLLVSGQIQKAEFSTSINEVRSQIQQVMDNAATGYYAQTTKFTCLRGNESLVIIPPDGTQARGTHNGCVFMGRALQFGVSSDAATDGQTPKNAPNDVPDPETFNIYNMMGAQWVKDMSVPLGYRSAANINESHVRPLSPDWDSYETGRAPDTKEVGTLQNGLKTVSMCYQEAATDPCQSIGAVAFLISLGNNQGSSASNPLSGNTAVDVYPAVGSRLADNERAGTMYLDDIFDPGTSPDSSYKAWLKAYTGTFEPDYRADQPKNPASGVKICFTSGTTNQSGQVTIIGGGGQLTTTLKIFNGKDCT
jgi:prepilin-type N-terminal cleavage/methylation domain-containing protein